MIHTYIGIKYIYILLLFINNSLRNNIIKQLRIQIIHRIVATECPYIQYTQNKVLQEFKCFHICKSVKYLYYIVVGYKISHSQYDDVNINLSYLIYTMYKAYIASDRWNTQINVFKLFYSELLIIEQYYKTHTLNTHSFSNSLNMSNNHANANFINTLFLL